MSKSPSNTRSPTPTSENPTANLRRNITEEHSRDSQSSGIRDESFAPLPIPPPPTQDTLGRPIRPAENSTSDSRMTKRIRTSDVGSGFNMQSGSSQHVQDNVASSSSSRITDSREQPTAVQSAPPKKKRTRTLTTPHQAAVLHALLAKACKSIQR
ncbi:hypothetical protein APHAL10511_005806 [Amanita phalloides]|nr:hypothetical protein APHAL10511_005806 [Amanita phalloides]